MKKKVGTKKVTTDDLAAMVAEGFSRVDIEIGEVKESIKDVRADILNLGDRFVSYHTFDQLTSRVTILEKKQK